MLTRIRLILGAVMVTSVGASVVLWTYLPVLIVLSEAGDLLAPLFFRFGLLFVALLLTPFIAALIMIIATFRNLEGKSDGTLCYSPDNFWWRLMSQWYRDRWGTEVRTCKALFLTDVLVIIFSAIILVAISVLSVLFGLVSDVYTAIDGGTLLVMDRDQLTTVGILGFLAYMILTGHFLQKKNWLGIIGRTMRRLFFLSIFVLFVAEVGVLPVRVIMANQGIELAEALLIYGKWAGIVVSVLAVVFGLFFGLFMFVPKIFLTASQNLHDTWFGRIFLFVHNASCPTMAEHQTPQKKTNAI